jgi:iron(III) transport system ATP-binding protein
VNNVGVKVEIDRLSLAFGKNPVLRDVSLEVAPGEFFGLLGPSGSGKSTLLRAIAGFGPPPSGQIRIAGADVTRVPPWRRGVGMMFQSYALWPHMTVWENVAFGLQEQRRPKSEITGRVAAVLELVGLAEFARRRPSQLSGGQQQRVALARTIVIEPTVLLLDEPLSNLDAKLRVQMREELKGLQRRLGLTTLFVTHDQEEALAIADRVAVLDQGMIQQVGVPMELYDRPASRFVAGFVGSVNLLEGEVRALDEGLRFVPRAAPSVTFPLPSGSPGPATLAFRPNALALALDEDAAAFRARVLGREFKGETIRYRFAVDETELVADLAHLAGGVALEAGQSVRLRVFPDQLRLLEA